MTKGFYRLMVENYKRRMRSVSGVSIVELMVALSLFAIMAAGAFAALSVFDQIQSNQVSQKNT